MKLSDLIISSLGPYEKLDPEAKISIGDHVFDLSEEDPEVSIVPFGLASEGKFTYQIVGLGTFDFNSGLWMQDV